MAGLHQLNFSPSLLDVAPAADGKMAGQVLVAEWGDLAPNTNPLRDDPVGYQISRLDPRKGVVVPFARNALPGQASDRQRPGQGFERPFDVKFGPDGAIYIADYGTARPNEARIRQGSYPYDFPVRTGAVWRLVPDGSRTGVVRVGGADRVATAAALSAANFLPGTPLVFVATAADCVRSDQVKARLAEFVTR